MASFKIHDFPPLPPQSTVYVDEAANAKAHDVAWPSVTIDDLPDELLLGVLQYLPKDTLNADKLHLPEFDRKKIDLGSLLALSSTNKRFRRLVIEGLYATYDSDFCEPYLFLRTMISNPYRAESVKHAILTYGSLAADRKRYAGNAQDKKMVKEGLKSLKLPGWKTWATDCNSESVEVDTLHTAILMHTPNIASMSIDGCRYDIAQDLEWLALFRHAHLGTSLGRVHRLQNLQSIRINMRDLKISYVGPVFRLPSLRKLCLEDIFGDAVHADDGSAQDSKEALQQIIPQRCNDIEEISLENTFLHTDALDVVFASTRSLKALKYIMLDDDDGNLGSAAIVTLLEDHKSSLESLEVHYGRHCVPNRTRAIDLREGVRDFTALKHIDCALSMLVSLSSVSSVTLGDKMPRSLVTLHVKLDRYPSGNCLNALEELATDRSTCTPALTEIRVNGSEVGKNFKYNWARLIAPFSRTDVSLVVDMLRHDSYGEDSGNWETSSEESDYDSEDCEVPSDESDEVSLYSNED
jgi:hypothetical protein